MAAKRKSGKSRATERHWERTWHDVVFVRDRGTCAHCKRQFSTKKHLGGPTLRQQLRLDHILPVADGGDAYDYKNLQTLCKQCHQVKTSGENSRRSRGKRVKHKESHQWFLYTGIRQL